MTDQRRIPGAAAFALALALQISLAAAAGGAAAQQAPADPPFREGEAEFSFVSTTGNASMRTLGTALELTLRPRGWELEAGGAFVRSRAEGEVNAESVTAMLRAGRSLTPRVQAQGEIAYLRNRFAGIDHRVSPELGANVRLVARPAHTVRASVAAGYVREVRLEEATRSFASATAGLRYRWQVSATAELTNEGSLVANLEEGEDWRIANRAALRVAITNVFSIRLSHTLEHLNDPVPGFQRTDTRMSVALVAGF